MEPDKKSNGALLGSIIIIIILVVGGVYIWKTSVEKRAWLQEEQNRQNLEAYEEDTTSIEAELNSTDLETLDSEI